MKKYIVFLLLNISFSYCYADSRINIIKDSGELISISLAKKPKLSYNNDHLSISYENTYIEIPLQNIVKVDVKDVATETDIKLNSINTTQRFLVYDADGRLILEGEQMNVKNLKKGLYIINDGTTIFKIYKN